MEMLGVIPPSISCILIGCISSVAWESIHYFSVHRSLASINLLESVNPSMFSPTLLSESRVVKVSLSVLLREFVTITSLYSQNKRLKLNVSFVCINHVNLYCVILTGHCVITAKS